MTTGCIYIDLLLLAGIVVFIVDLSGFTQSWKTLLARWFHAKAIGSVKPFDCSLCMVWWTSIIYCLITHNLCLITLAYSALLSFLALPIGGTLIMAREALTFIINKLTI